MTPDFMTNKEFRDIRESLGLSHAELGKLLGYEPGPKNHSARMQVYRMETNRRPIKPLVARMMRAYAAGHRPTDWPPNAVAPRGQSSPQKPR